MNSSPKCVVLPGKGIMQWHYQPPAMDDRILKTWATPLLPSYSMVPPVLVHKQTWRTQEKKMEPLLFLSFFHFGFVSG